MGTKKISERVLLVTLREEPHACEEISAVNEMMMGRHEFDIIVDFSRAELLTSSSITNLLILRDQVTSCGRRLVLCNVAFITKCMLSTLGIEAGFHFAADKSIAIEALESSTC